MWSIEQSPVGRIAVPPALPPNTAVFCTTVDYEGRVTPTLMTVVRERFNIDATLTTCVQVHGKRVERAFHAENWRECDECDALWSGETRTALGIKVADCLPITMVDPSHAVIANIHSGWRGAVQQIAAETIDAIAGSTAFDPASAHVYLGPSIRACCFEVGEEVAEQFDARFIDRSRPKPHVDLVAFTTAILRERGFADERISDSELCTRCEGSIFHSYRRVGKGGGRNLAVVAQ